MTSSTETLDQGVTCSVDVKYHSEVIKMTISAIDTHDNIPKVIVSDAMNLLMLSGEDVTNNSCFAKVKILNNDQLEAQND